MTKITYEGKPVKEISIWSSLDNDSDAVLTIKLNDDKEYTFILIGR